MTAKLTPVRPPREETKEDLELRRAKGLARVGNFIARLQEKGYFGKVTVSLQNGVITQLLLEQIYKDEDF